MVFLGGIAGNYPARQFFEENHDEPLKYTEMIWHIFYSCKNLQVRVIARVRGWDIRKDSSPFPVRSCRSGLGASEGFLLHHHATQCHLQHIYVLYNTIITIVYIYIYTQYITPSSPSPALQHGCRCDSSCPWSWTTKPVKPSHLEAGAAVFGYAKSWISERQNLGFMPWRKKRNYQTPPMRTLGEKSSKSNKTRNEKRWLAAAVGFSPFPRQGHALYA